MWVWLSCIWREQNQLVTLCLKYGKGWKKSHISGIAMMLIFVWLCAHNDMRTFWRFEGGIEFWKIGNNLDQNCHPSTAFPHPQFFENVPLLALKDRHLDPAEAFVFLVIFFCKKYVSTYRFWPKFFLKLYHILNTTVVTRMCLCGNVKLDKRRSSWLCFVNIFSKSPRFFLGEKKYHIMLCFFVIFMSKLGTWCWPFLSQSSAWGLDLYWFETNNCCFLMKKKKINFFFFFREINIQLRSILSMCYLTSKKKERNLTNYEIFIFFSETEAQSSLLKNVIDRFSCPICAEVSLLDLNLCQRWSICKMSRRCFLVHRKHFF